MADYKPLTKKEIAALPEELKPGYEGEDEQGRYRVNEYGEKRRAFQKGGPSPNPKGRPEVEHLVDATQMIEKNNWMNPVEFFMAVMNCDARTINKLRPQSNKITKADIRFKDQMEAAAKILPHYLKQAESSLEGEISDKEDSGLKAEEEAKDSYAVLELPTPGRRSMMNDD